MVAAAYDPNAGANSWRVLLVATLVATPFL